MSAGGRPPPPTGECCRLLLLLGSLLFLRHSGITSFPVPGHYRFFFLAFFLAMLWITPFRAQYPIASRRRYSACSRPRRS